jgi:hypothetical protein
MQGSASGWHLFVPQSVIETIRRMGLLEGVTLANSYDAALARLQSAS